MNEAWEPGTVGVATVDGEEVSGAWVVSEVGLPYFSSFTSTALVKPYQVIDFRPFVVIDPEDGGQSEQLLAGLRRVSFSAFSCLARPCLRGVLRSLLPKPTPVKPEEPQNLLARVRLRDGRTAYRWTIEIAARNAWRFEDSTHLTTKYDSLDVVEVLSEGVES